MSFFTYWVVINRSKDWDINTLLFGNFFYNVTNCTLVVTVQVRAQEADYDGFNALVDQLSSGFTGFVQTNGEYHATFRVNTLGYTASIVYVNQRLVVTVSVKVQTIFKGITQVALNRTAHTVKIFKAFTYDQTSAQTFTANNPVQHGSTGEYAGYHLRENFFYRQPPVSKCIPTGLHYC